MKKEDKELIECARKLKKHCIDNGCGECCLQNIVSGCFVNACRFPHKRTIPSFKPALTDVQKAILGSIDEDYKWIAKDESGSIYVYKQKTVKDEYVWKYDGEHEFLSGLKPELFDFLSWEDEEPTYIPDLLKEG